MPPPLVVGIPGREKATAPLHDTCSRYDTATTPTITVEGFFLPAIPCKKFPPIFFFVRVALFIFIFSRLLRDMAICAARNMVGNSAAAGGVVSGFGAPGFSKDYYGGGELPAHEPVPGFSSRFLGLSWR